MVKYEIFWIFQSLIWRNWAALKDCNFSNIGMTLLLKKEFTNNCRQNENLVSMQEIRREIQEIAISVADPGSGAFLTPGSGIQDG